MSKSLPLCVFQPIAFNMKSLFGVAILLVIFSGQTYSFKVYCKSEYFRQRVAKPNCDSKFVGVYACLGTCGSYILPLSRSPYFRKFCYCCKPTGTQWEKVHLNCAGGIDPVVKVESVTGCTCLSCN